MYPHPTPKENLIKSVSSDDSTIDMNDATELNLCNIVCISQSNASNPLISNSKPPHAKDKKRMRFVSIEITDGNSERSDFSEESELSDIAEETETETETDGFAETSASNKDQSAHSSKFMSSH